MDDLADKEPRRRFGGSASRGEAAASGSGVEPPHGDPTPSAVAATDEEARIVREAIERIPDETDRRIVTARFFDALSLREVSRRLEIPYKRVRARFHAAMTLLERELGARDSGD